MVSFKKIFKAVYDYEAAAEDELSFSEDNILGIITDEEANDDGWVYGCNILKDPETCGFIPITYCEELCAMEVVKANYTYEAQEDNEISFFQGQDLEILYKIDEDWWLAKGQDECGMVPANYFDYEDETAEAEEFNSEPPILSNEPESLEPEETEEEYYEERNSESKFEEDESYEEESQDHYEQPQSNSFSFSSIPPPPPPLPKNPVENIEESDELKMKCDALFLDSKNSKCKGQLMLEKALYFCTESSIEHCYDMSELRDYDAAELKLTLISGDKIAIGLGKKDAKKFAEIIKEISGYEPVEEVEIVAPPLPKAPSVTGPKMPQSTSSSFGSAKPVITKVPMMVSVNFEGMEGDEISIFEGEEVYLLSSSDESGHFARIEKINGVQGIVPRNFMMTRSDYQKKVVDAEKAIKEADETEKQFSNMNINMPSVQVPRNANVNKPVDRSPIPVPLEVAHVQAVAPMSKAVSKSKNNPWSALASGLAPNNPSTSSSPTVKLENSRLWKDKSGKFQVEAEFVSLSDGKVTILKRSGSQVKVPLDVLSEKDIEYACKRAGVPVPKSRSSTITTVKGFDWAAFFLSVGFDVGKAREFGEKFASQSFEEAMISAFTSDFLSGQGMQIAEIYKILPEAAKRRAQAMQTSAKDKHRSNTNQVVLRPVEASTGSESQLTEYEAPTKEASRAQLQSNVLATQMESSSIEIAKFPSIEELEGAIEVGTRGSTGSRVTLPNGISVSKTSSDNTRVLVQAVDSNANAADIKERSREIVGADGSMAKEYTRISTSTTVAPFADPNGGAIALLQQQMAQGNAIAQAQIQMRIQAQAQAQAQMQMQMQMRVQAQAQAQYAAAQAQQQHRYYQMQQQQQQQAAQPSVHITINTGDKGGVSTPNPSVMTPPLQLMNPPMMQMNNPMAMMNGVGVGAGAGGMNGMMNMTTPMNAMNSMPMPMPMPMNSMNTTNPMNQMNQNYNSFDPTNNQFYGGNNVYPPF